MPRKDLSVAELSITTSTQAARETASERSVRKATLMLGDGTCFHGTGLGTPALVDGELVFTTAMTGYEEALTDPSYRGQLLMFTYPLIGNYGVCSDPGAIVLDPTSRRDCQHSRLCHGGELITLVPTRGGRHPDDV